MRDQDPMSAERRLPCPNPANPSRHDFGCLWCDGTGFVDAGVQDAMSEPQTDDQETTVTLRLSGDLVRAFMMQGRGGGVIEGMVRRELIRRMMDDGNKP